MNLGGTQGKDRVYTRQWRGGFRSGASESGHFHRDILKMVGRGGEIVLGME